MVFASTVRFLFGETETSRVIMERLERMGGRPHSREDYTLSI